VSHRSSVLLCALPLCSGRGAATVDAFSPEYDDELTYMLLVSLDRVETHLATLHNVREWQTHTSIRVVQACQLRDLSARGSPVTQS